MKEIFLWLSVLAEILAYLVYIRAIFGQKAKPHRTTRFILLILSTITVVSLITQHDNVALWIAIVYGFFSWILFLLSFKYGMGGWAKTDIVCLIIALAGIAIWRFTNNPALALYSAIIADFTGMLPTILKTCKKPNTEVWYFFFLAGLGAELNLFAVQVWILQQYAFPLYILLINLVMVGLLVKASYYKRK